MGQIFCHFEGSTKLFDTLDENQIQQIVSLGRVLHVNGWTSEEETINFTRFENQPDKNDRKFFELGYIFFVRYRERLQGAICDGTSVKNEISNISDLFTTTVEMISQINTVEIPSDSYSDVAQILLSLGLEKFCEWR